MGVFDFLRRRPAPPIPRTWTRAKDVAVFAGRAESRFELERMLAREGIQARTFEDASGRAVEILTRFLPSVVLIRADQLPVSPIMAALGAVPGLNDVPIVLAAPASLDRTPLVRDLGTHVGGVCSSDEPSQLVLACRELAPELDS